MQAPDKGDRRMTFRHSLLTWFAACLLVACQKPGTAIEPARLDSLGLDASNLSLQEQKVLTDLIQTTTSPCNEQGTLEKCLRATSSCAACKIEAADVLLMIRRGMSASKIANWLNNRFEKSATKSVPIDGSPSHGPNDAPVTIVEFADFNCPHCARYSPLVFDFLDKLPEWKGKVRLVFKNYPLDIQGHEYSVTAAHAAMAAARQNKFWEMERYLFEHTGNLSNEVVETGAKQLSLDFAAFRADWMSAAVDDAVSKDKGLGNALGIMGTPTFYINGRLFTPLDLDNYEDEFKEWVNVEIQITAAPK
jgi:protein-disulfide isomerase